MNEDDYFLDECLKEVKNDNTQYHFESLAERIINEVDYDFRHGGTEEKKQRDQEIKQLKEDIAKLKRELNSLGNCKNHKKTEINNKLAVRRQKLRKEIKQRQVRLQEIEIECS